MSPITSIELLSFQVPWRMRSWDSDGLHEATIVRITDADGRCGLGEVGAPAAAAEALLHTTETQDWRHTLVSQLLGQDPLEASAVWDRLYAGIQAIGRRGVGIALLSGLDIALHDLAARQHQVPVFKLLGGARSALLQPYATVWPGLPHGRSLAELMAVIESKTVQALTLGYRAIKIEVMFGTLADDTALVGLIQQARRMVGASVALAIDFGYRWRHWRDAAWLLNRVADCNLLFAEAALQHDDLEGHAKLAAQGAVPICGAELAATRWEIREWIERGRVDIVQPCITRAGGFSEMRRIAELCELNGVTLVPHGWTSGLGAACQLHLQAASAVVPWIEHVPPALYEAPLRSTLVSPEAELRDGGFALPSAPGLGIELCEEAARHYLVHRPEPIRSATTILQAAGS